ncbi:ABC transporter substrate-binding protein [Halomicrobium salinisoli]|uniref:ABC transporter substrate-binding protein n=1 Tax=Halomicrobium salinisoli TaxID=2878391 RepID=UPI001CF00386|nr:ABC transporter substrate-binding protein [Halomicrobium salinisoli]
MADESESYRDVISRRRFVELTGVSGAAALAGCGGDGGGTDGESGDGGSEDGGTGGGSSGVHDVTHLSMTNQVPANIQFNMQNPNSRAQISHQILYDVYARFNFAEGDFQSNAIEDWEFTGDTFEMTLREGLTWDDGDPVTSDEVALNLRLDQLTGGSLWDYADSVETPDDQTVVLNISDDINPTIVEFDVIDDRYVHQKPEHFEEYWQTYQDGNEDEAARQLQEFAYQDVVASGPFSKEQAGQQQLLTSRREDHPDAENINFSEYAFRYIDGNQQTHQALINMELDSVFSVFAAPEVVDQMPDAVRLETVPSKWGYGLVPNHDADHVSDRAVRQAIQYVLDRQTIVENVGNTLKTAPEVPVGIPTDDQQRWLGDAMSDFNTYGVDESMTDEATAVLEEAGYSKNDGTWQDPDGNAVKLPVTVPTGWTDWVTATETIVDQLNSFGFDATVDSRSFDSLLSTAWPNGDFKLSAGGWLPGGGRAAFAYFSLHHQLIENFRGFTYNYDAAADSRGGSRADVTVPSMDGDGEMTVNPSDRLAELSSTTDEELTQEIVLEQAWVTNVDLPMIPVMEKLEETFLTTDEWDIPEEGDGAFQVRWANTWLPRQGELSYSGE